MVGAEGARARDVLPIELLNSFRLLAGARLDYLDAIVDYNESQFAMYVALGQPPADALAHPVPTEGVRPTGLPAPPGGTPPGPQGFNPPSNAAGARSAGVAPAPSPARNAREAVPTVSLRPMIPPPSAAPDRLNPAGP
jgi:hypothetical protein